MYDEQVVRLRSSWDLLVGGSPSVSSHLHALVPELHDRIVTIPHGVQVPTDLDREPGDTAAEPGLLVMGWGREAAGVTAEVMAALRSRGVGYRLTLLDPAADVPVPSDAGVTRLPNRGEWAALCRTHHAILAFDWHHDRRRQMIEAMGHGVVPMVWGETQSDAPFRAGATGYTLQGDTAALIDLLEQLHDPEHWSLAARRCRDDVVGRHYSIDQMVDAFIDRFGWVREQPPRRSDTGTVLPAPEVVGAHRIFGAAFEVETEWGRFPDEESVTELGRAWPCPTAPESA
jgi:hypothetical protein